jgi:hypothetical protein
MRTFVSNLTRVTPNPNSVYNTPARVTAVVVGGGVRLDWVSDYPAPGWRVFRQDASEGGPQVLVAELPAQARSWTDFKDAPTNRYTQGHALTYSVLPVE